MRSIIAMTYQDYDTSGNGEELKAHSDKFKGSSLSIIPTDCIALHWLMNR